MNIEDSNKNCGIYCWTNKVNDKKYIGQSVDLKQRKYEFTAFGNKIYAGRLINNARQKYNSAEYWSYQVLEYCFPEELDEKEITYIYLYNTYDRSLGYNLTIGGDGAHSSSKGEIYQINPVTREIVNKWMSQSIAARSLNIDIRSISASCSKSKNFANGYVWRFIDDYDESEEYYLERYNHQILQYDLECNFIREWKTKAELCKELNIPKRGISQHCKIEIPVGYTGYYGYVWRYKYNPLPVGYKIPQKEIKEKIIKSNKKKVYQYSLDGSFICEWNSVFEAANFYNIKKTNVSACCRDKCKSAGGYIWKFYKVDNVPEYQNDSYRPVVQLDLNGNYLNTFNSCCEAVRALKLKTSSKITMCCKKKRKHAYSYVWRYLDEYNADEIISVQKRKFIEVLQYDSNMNLIREWDKLSEAVKFHNISRKKLLCHCDKKSDKDLCGFIWRYKRDTT